MNKIYKILSYESPSLSTLTNRLNNDLDNYKHFESSFEVDVNKKSGNYYYILTVFQ